FLAALEADPPAAILLTNDQWPKGQGFEAADNWPEFMTLLTSHYDLNLTGHEGYILWRFYLRRARNRIRKFDELALRRADYAAQGAQHVARRPALAADAFDERYEQW